MNEIKENLQRKDKIIKWRMLELFKNKSNVFHCFLKKKKKVYLELDKFIDQLKLKAKQEALRCPQ